MLEVGGEPGTRFLATRELGSREGRDRLPRGCSLLLRLGRPTDGRKGTGGKGWLKVGLGAAAAGGLMRLLLPAAGRVAAADLASAAADGEEVRRMGILSLWTKGSLFLA